MLTRVHRLQPDERGMSLVFGGTGFTAFLAVSSSAIDVGMFMTSRSQAQYTGALAGSAPAGALRKVIRLSQ